jgi:hypothetical protein
MIIMTTAGYEAVARALFIHPNGYKDRLCANSERMKWSTYFGTSSIVMADIWNRIDPVRNVDPLCEPHHLLWGFLLLKKYSGDELSSDVVYCCRVTFSKWAWILIEQVHNLHVEVVSLAD